MKPPPLEIQIVREAARGHWGEIIPSLTGIDPAILNHRRHFPCPKCQAGKDRFRVFPDFAETGGAICSQCFSRDNGDGFSFLQWYNDWPFVRVKDEVAKFLGLGENNGHAPKLEIVETVAKRKGMPIEAARAYGARRAMRDGQPVARFPMYDHAAKLCSHFDIGFQGKLEKGLNANGLEAGLFLADGTPPMPGQMVLIVEGVKDAAALRAQGYEAVGLPTSKMDARFARLFRGCHVVVVPDRDVAGEGGARATASRLCGVAETVRIATLPGELKEKDGDGVREVLRRRDGPELLRLAIEDAPEWKLTDTQVQAEDDPGEDGNATDLEVEQQTDKPEVFLPGASVPVVRSAAQFGELLAGTKCYFRRGQAVVKLGPDDDDEPVLQPVKPAALSSAFEMVARLKRWKQTKNGSVPAPGICPEQSAKLILNSDAFLNELPPIRLLSRCPVLVERGGELVQIVGYDRESGVLAFGDEVPDVPLDEAKDLLRELIADFLFASESDRSRALAAFITPALVHGGLLGGRAPVDLGEADQSQTGKGFRNKITAALYRQTVRTVTQRKGGVGSLEETFSSALIAGANFIALDNIRGKVDSPAIESFLTEDRYAARVPYSGDVEIDPKCIVLMMTSNRAEITPDMANRSNCTRLLKQEPGYEFAKYPEGDILDRIRANQPRYLGAVFAVIREWHRRGKPRSHETRHDFRRWAQTLGWIVQNIFDAVPLLDGHAETKARMTNPALTWLRDVALAVVRAKREGERLRAHEILDLLASTDVEIPGANEDADLEDNTTRNRVLQAIGRKMARCFSNGESTIEIDNLTIERSESKDHEFRKLVQYEFQQIRSPLRPRYTPAMDTAIENLDPAIPRGSTKDSPDSLPERTDINVLEAAGDSGHIGGNRRCGRCEDHLRANGTCPTCENW